MRARLLAACLLALLVLPGAAPAAAHTVMAGADLRIAQTIAGTELTVVVKATARVPGPLRVGVVAYQRVADLPVELELRSVADGRTVTGLARAALEPQYAELTVDRTGPHELRLRAGGEVAVVPFRVLVQRGSAGELLIYGGLLVAGLLLVGGLLTGALSRPGPAMLLSGGAAVGLTVATMVIVFEPGLPPAPPDGAAPIAGPVAGTPPGGRPYAQGRVTTAPARPAAGEDFTLRFDLADGSTGRPVDDLAVHHEALAHVVVTSEDGHFFRHVHPLRTAPGRLEVRLRADRTGRYLAYAELERQDAGGQLITGTFSIGGDPAKAENDDPATPTTTQTGDNPATAENDATPTAAQTDPAPSTTAGTEGDATPPVGGDAAGSGTAVPRLRPAAPVAGRPATIDLDAGEPVRPWLGMAGHLIVRSQDGAFLGHVHEMGSAGPRLRFTFSFPAAGRYLAWAQYATADRIVTVPFTVDVSAQEAVR